MPEAATTPAAPPVPAPTTPAAPADGKGTSAPSRAERKAVLIKDMKASSSAEAAPSTSSEPAPAPAADGKPVAPVERKAAEFGEVARQHKKVLEAQEAVKRERAELAAMRADAELGKALREGNWSKLKEAHGDDWYDKATLHVVGEKKPHAPEVVEKKLNERIEQLEQKLEEKTKPAEIPEEVVRQRVDEFKTGVGEIVKADARFTSLQKEPAADVANEVYAYLERVFDAEVKAGRTPRAPTRDDVIDACSKLEAVLRSQNDLTRKPGDATVPAGDTRKRENQPQQARGESDSGGSKTTLTAEVHASVPVSDQVLTKEQRRAKAKAMLRADSEAND